MMLHAALVQKLIMNEKMAAVDRPPIVWKRRTGNCKGGADFPQKELDHRADISTRGRVEGRAVFEVELPASNQFQPMECLHGFAHGLFDGSGSRLERANPGVDLFELRSRFRDTDRLNSSKSAFNQVIG